MDDNTTNDDNDKTTEPDEKNLKQFTSEQNLPCFAYVINHKSTDSKIDENVINNKDGTSLINNDVEEITSKQELYLLKIFESDCVFARCYSSNLEDVLINQRTSFAQSDVDYFTWTSNYLTLTQARKNMISEEVVIPFGYQGLFEMFSANLSKLGGILDHETDIITLASRFTTPACYYVAKELNVYEILNQQSSSIIHKYLRSLNILEKSDEKFNENKHVHYNRKWTKLPVGCICKAMRVVDIDCFNNQSSYYMGLCQALFCCYKSKNKSEMAIEFKVIENFDEILVKSSENLTSEKSESVSWLKNNLTKIKLSEKSFFIPVDVDNPNKSIDLIPIASLNKSLLIKNSLQTIKNFEDIDKRENFNIEMKLFADNLFPASSLSSRVSTKKIRSDSKTEQNLNAELCKLNLKLEISKFSSIFETYEWEKNCSILVGYNLNTQQLFFTPIAKANPKSKFIKMNKNEMRNSSLVQKFQQKKINLVYKLTDLKVNQFNIELNKLETFANGKQMTDTNTADIMYKKKFHPNISHFADLINCDFKKGSISVKSIQNKSRFKIVKQNSADVLLNISQNNNIKCKLLMPFSLKKYHSQNSINQRRIKRPMSVVLSHDLRHTIIAKMGHLKMDFSGYSEIEIKLESFGSLDFVEALNKNCQTSKLEGLHKTKSNLCRSRSLPSIFNESSFSSTISSYYN